MINHLANAPLQIHWNRIFIDKKGLIAILTNLGIVIA